MRKDGPWVTYTHACRVCILSCNLLFFDVLCFLGKEVGIVSVFSRYWLLSMQSDCCQWKEAPSATTGGNTHCIPIHLIHFVCSIHTDCSIIKYCTWHFWAFATFVVKLHFHKMFIVNNTGQVSWAFMFQKEFLFFVPPFGTIGTISSLFPCRYSSANGENVP